VRLHGFLFPVSATQDAAAKKPCSREMCSPVFICPHGKEGFPRRYKRFPQRWLTASPTAPKIATGSGRPSRRVASTLRGLGACGVNENPVQLNSLLRCSLTFLGASGRVSAPQKNLSQENASTEKGFRFHVCQQRPGIGDPTLALRRRPGWSRRIRLADLDGTPPPATSYPFFRLRIDFQTIPPPPFCNSGNAQMDPRRPVQNTWHAFTRKKWPILRANGSATCGGIRITTGTEKRAHPEDSAPSLPRPWTHRCRVLPKRLPPHR